jgi:hypothetical protein
MKSMRILFAVVCACSMLAASAVAADQKAAPQKKTCCEEAAAKGKECRHKCCVAAHKDDKSCTACNSQQQDLKLKQKNSKKSEVNKASNATSAQ